MQHAQRAVLAGGAEQQAGVDAGDTVIVELGGRDGRDGRLDQHVARDQALVEQDIAVAGVLAGDRVIGDVPVAVAGDRLPRGVEAVATEAVEQQDRVAVDRRVRVASVAHKVGVEGRRLVGVWHRRTVVAGIADAVEILVVGVGA
ncbi:MAG: hypothetical protein A2138_16845 [Deltaproteobacteria bacterium RBG_16_71_12]|nr:MAG: hypothetical protein A2138_16845 [Deltaproteobacteria bacterium RBG_16_71_12]